MYVHFCGCNAGLRLFKEAKERDSRGKSVGFLFRKCLFICVQRIEN